MTKCWSSTRSDLIKNKKRASKERRLKSLLDKAKELATLEIKGNTDAFMRWIAEQ